jgi:hypothetical protein
MKFIQSILFISLAVAILASCRCPSARQTAKTSDPEIILSPVIREGFRAPATKPDYVIESASLEKNTLVLRATYPGGCKEHRFDLIFNGMYLKSLPMKAVLYLEHTTKDTCTLPQQVTLRYQVKDLIPPGHDKLILLLQSYDKDLLLVTKEGKE